MAAPNLRGCFSYLAPYCVFVLWLLRLWSDGPRKLTHIRHSFIRVKNHSVEDAGTLSESCFRADLFRDVIVLEVRCGKNSRRRDEGLILDRVWG